jgi:transcriptional regulator with XRE-family HTH domain
VHRFGEKLRALRKRQGLTLKQLAEKLCFESHSYLSAVEFGKKKPSVDLVIKIAILFEVSTDDLLFDEREV